MKWTNKKEEKMIRPEPRLPSFYLVRDSRFSELPRPLPTPPQYKLGVQKYERIQRGRGAGGPDPPLKNHKNIGFLSNTGTDPLKFSKL